MRAEVLFLTTVLPHRRQIGSEVASQAIIDGLRAAGVGVHTVGYLRPEDRSPLPADTTVAGTRYIETRRARLYPAAWLALSMLKGLPYSAAKYWSRGYAARVTRLLATGRYGTIVVDHPQMGWLAGLIPPAMRLIFVAHNVEDQMYLELSRASRGRLGRCLYGREARRMRDLQAGLVRRAFETWALTDADAGHFRALGGNSRVMPLPGAADGAPGAAPKRFDIGLIGNWAWQANIEGLRWFMDDIHPRLPAGLSTRIAGRDADGVVPRAPDVQCVGFVPEAVTFMRQARVVAIPMRSGGGIQIKTLDAIGSGSFIVATSRALRGIAHAPATVATADEAVSFAGKLAEALRRPDGDAAAADAIAWSAARQRAFQDEMSRIAGSLT